MSPGVYADAQKWSVQKVYIRRERNGTFRHSHAVVPWRNSLSECALVQLWKPLQTLVLTKHAAGLVGQTCSMKYSALLLDVDRCFLTVLSMFKNSDEYFIPRVTSSDHPASFFNLLKFAWRPYFTWTNYTYWSYQAITKKIKNNNWNASFYRWQPGKIIAFELQTHAHTQCVIDILLLPLWINSCRINAPVATLITNALGYQLSRLADYACL